VPQAEFEAILIAGISGSEFNCPSDQSRDESRKNEFAGCITQVRNAPNDPKRSD
jgi:hypothetical protein